MTFRPALTQKQLHDIGVRRDPDDILALLWEIKRLRAIVLRVDQLQRGMSLGGGPGMLLDALRNDLKGEPCIDEQCRLDISAPPPV